MLDQLTTKSPGKQFDESYMDAMEMAHAVDIATFEVKDKQPERQPLNHLLQKRCPMLRSHHTMAGEIEKMIDIIGARLFLERQGLSHH